LPLVAFVIAVTACSGSPSTPRVAAATGGTGPHPTAPATVTQLIHTAAQCLRDHGIPNFPDPVLDTHGELQYDDQLLKNLPAAVSQAAQLACRSKIDAAQASATAARPPATPQDIAQATRFAQCMRQHGWPNFPDPDSHASFQFSNPNDGPTTKRDPSFQACAASQGTRSQ
jgi:hypothetical protein